MDTMRKPKRRTVVENGDTGEDLVLATLIRNGDDLAPIVRHAFEMGRPETLLLQLKTVVKKKEAEIEEICKSHYEEFILAVDELRGVLVDAEDLKSELASDNFRLQEVGTALLIKLEELLQSYSIKKNVTEAIKMGHTEDLEVGGEGEEFCQGYWANSHWPLCFSSSAGRRVAPKPEESGGTKCIWGWGVCICIRC